MATCLPARAVMYTATLDQISPIFGIPNSLQLLTPSVVPLLTGDFSMDKTFELRFEAPAGQKFNVAPPAGFNNPTLGMIFTAPGAAAFTGVSSPATVAYEGLTGSTPGSPSLTQFDTSLTSDAFLAAADGIPITGDFSFTAITATFTVPATYNASFTAATPANVLMLFLANGSSDPGQWVTLMDVAQPPMNNGAIPEPITATLGLMGLGVLGIATKRRPKA